MTLGELRALFSDMLSKDLTPMFCDTEVVKYDAYVPCGEPTECCEDVYENVLLPKELLSMNPEFMVPVRGDSMRDVNIVTGDVVRVIGDTTPYDGDIVLACIDGEYTLKTYCEDEEGKRWLVPQNEKYMPILLDEKRLVRIVGRVKEVVKKAPRVSFRQCKKAIDKAKTRERKPQVPTQEVVSKAIREIAPKIKIARHWYAVFRVLVDKMVFSENGYNAFVNNVIDVMPGHEHLPKEIELQRLAVQSFAKPVELWREENAPVKGKRYYAYLDLAREMEKLLIVN